MRKKTLLVIGGLNNVHIYNIVKNVLVFTDFDITMYNMDGGIVDINQDFINFYHSHNIKIIGGGNVARDGTFRYTWIFYKTIKALGRFDIVNMFFVSHYFAPVLYLFRKNYGKIILNFWGSDVFRSNFSKRISYLPLVKKADILSFTGERIRDHLLSYSLFKGLSDKCVIRAMGIPLVSEIGRLRETKTTNDWKNEFGIICGRKTIAIGYHGRRAMQQYEVVNSLLSDATFPINEVQFLIPCRGMDMSTRASIENMFREHGAAYQFYDGYFSDQSMAKYRLLSDIFINAQTTDIGSGSMIEHVCAGSILINASWLIYPNLDKRNVVYYKFNDFSSLPGVLYQVLGNYDKCKKECELNFEKYAPFLSWENKRDQWLELYKA